MRSGLAAGLICLGMAALPVVSALGMQFRPVPVSSTEVVLDGRGPIVPGDTERLMSALSAASRAGRAALALALDSGGGNVAEARQMVAVIQARRLPVVIPPDSQCASACFLLLAASSRRFAAPDALIGVHSASQNGAETDTSLAVTTLMARDAAELGVPASIIGKMVETTPGRVEWLDPGDLVLMHVTVVAGDLLAALRQPVAAPVQGGLPAPVPLAQPSPASAHTEGMSDRRGWEVWLAGLQGAYRQGAIFAQTHISDAQPASCYGPNNLNRGDFTLGCDVARQRLTPVIGKIRSSADYATGWNVWSPPSVVTERAEQEYQGVYFCGRQIAHLTLKLLQASADARQRALFVFGPHDNSPGVPSGSFMVEGVVELNGGLMTLVPVRWVSQPTGYQLLGLSGRSDDGGKTFSGHVVPNGTCSRFTLALVQKAGAVK